MSVKMITTDELRHMKGGEGLILQGCGGNLDEWVEGINDMFTDEGILKEGSKFENCLAFENNGVTCLLFPFKNVKIETGITIPNSVTIIGIEAFHGCYNLTIKCFNGSYAEQYAIENDINYELLDANPTVNPSEKPSQNSSNNPSQNPTNNSNNNPTNSSQNPNNNQSNKPNNNTNKQNPTTAPTTIKKAKIKNLKAKAKGKK